RIRMSARLAHMPVQRGGMGARRIAYLARTNGRGRAAVDAHQHHLDSVGGAHGLTALTSGFERLDAWVKATAARADLRIATHLPLMANSDHANFAAHGIPAVRLIAGFNAPDSNLRLVLTAADTRDKVRE